MDLLKSVAIAKVHNARFATVHSVNYRDRAIACMWDVAQRKNRSDKQQPVLYQ